MHPPDRVDEAQLRVEPDPHDGDWLLWRVYPRGPKWVIQSNRAFGRVPWRDYPHLHDFQVTPERCILWLALFSEPLKEASNGGKKATKG